MQGERESSAAKLLFSVGARVALAVGLSLTAEATLVAPRKASCEEVSFPLKKQTILPETLIAICVNGDSFSVLTPYGNGGENYPFSGKYTGLLVKSMDGEEIILVGSEPDECGEVSFLLDGKVIGTLPISGVENISSIHDGRVEYIRSISYSTGSGVTVRYRMDASMDGSSEPRILYANVDYMDTSPTTNCVEL